VDAFNYLSVLLSIIIGLGLTQVLTAIGRLIRHRALVRFYWPPVLWAVLLILIYVQTWWAMFGLRDYRAWRFIDFLVVLAQTVTLYMMAAVVLPETVSETPVDLRVHYDEQHRWFFGFFLATLVISVLKDVTLSRQLPGGINLAFHALFATMAIVAVTVRNSRTQEALAIVGCAAFAGYVTILFAALH
jgi:cellulose synthase/poly-beta-1,6-N-acetylglucosamine synthase-like glycosyltransferase